MKQFCVSIYSAVAVLLRRPRAVLVLFAVCASNYLAGIFGLCDHQSVTGILFAFTLAVLSLIGGALVFLEGRYWQTKALLRRFYDADTRHQ